MWPPSAPSMHILTHMWAYKENGFISNPRAASICPHSLRLFSIAYKLLIKRLITKYRDTFIYVDDIALIVKDYSELEQLLAYLSAWGSQNGIQFNRNETEVYHFHMPRSSVATLGGAQQAKHMWWRQHRLEFKDPMFTYWDHTIVGVGYRVRLGMRSSPPYKLK